MKKLFFVAILGALVACGETSTETTTDSTAVIVDSMPLTPDTTILVDTAAGLSDTTAVH